MDIHPAVAAYLADWDQHRWLIEEEEAEAARRAEAAKTPEKPARPILTAKKAAE